MLRRLLPASPAARRVLALLACAGVLLGTAWYVGSQFDPPAPRPAPGTVRLGPEMGEAVDGYLARLPVELPGPGVQVLALVQFGAEKSTDEVLALLSATGPAAAVGTAVGPPSAAVSVVFRVPVPRVQTALRFATLDPGVALSPALGTARDRAWFDADTDAMHRSGRPAEVAAVEAAALADPGCRCLLAFVVRSDRSGLEALVARPEVRAVHAAPPGVLPFELALSPLLPEQTDRADPLPDDGPVPPA